VTTNTSYNELDEFFPRRPGENAALALLAKRKLARRNKRAVIIDRNGMVSINCAHQYLDERLGVTEADVNIRAATRCRPGRKAGVPIIRKM